MHSQHLERSFSALGRVLASLSPKGRAVFLLSARDGCTVDQIAADWRISRSLVVSYLAEAIQECSRQIRTGRESPRDVKIQAKAADWLVEFLTGESDFRIRERFSRWRRASRANMRAFIDLASLWGDARLYDNGRTIDVESLIAATRTEPSVVPANSGRFKWAAAAVIAIVIIAGLLARLLVVSPSLPQEYATRIGEQRTVSLSDGSTVKLDGNSRIRTYFSAHERRVDLLEGQALFTVAKHPERPFVVVSDGTRVRDVGTQFDVNRLPSEDVVTVLEGRVEVTRACAPTAALSSSLGIAQPIEVSAGQQVDVTCKITPRPQRANLMAATAWTRNMLIFESTPLTQAAVEFNRFNTRQLVIQEAQLQNIHVGGLFRASDPASLPRFLQVLRARPGIKVIEAHDRIIITKK